MRGYISDQEVYTVDELRRRVSDKPWLPDEEQALVAQIARDMAETYERGGVEATPLHVLRVDGLASQVLAVRRIEALVANWAPPTADNGEKGASKSHGAGTSLVQLVDALGKAWERVMKMAKEIEEGLGTSGPAKPLGLAERVRPLLKETEGALEDALEFERKKRRRQQKAATRSRESPAG